MATVASNKAWFNGEIVDREWGAPSIASVSFHLGTGVFDGMVAYWNNDHYYKHCFEEHMARFRTGAATMGMPLRWSVTELVDAADALLSVEPAGTQYVRPIAYRKAPELWVTGGKNDPVDVSIFTVRIERTLAMPISGHLSPIERVSSKAVPAHTKVSGTYVNSFYARRTAEAAGFGDAIMLDRDGRVAEASAANVFAIFGERLQTPPINPDVFPGITRTVILRLARELGVDVEERDISAPELDCAAGVFLCSTLMEIRPMWKLGQRTISTDQSIVFREVLSAFDKLVGQ